MSLIKKGQMAILITAILLVIIFSVIAFQRKNYEFIMYIGVILAFILLILFTIKKSNLSNLVLWGLVVWAFLHMTGGLIYVNGQKVYTLVLIDLFTIGSDTFFRFDHLVHIIGFGTATYLCYELIRGYLNKNTNWKVLSVLIVLMGMGVGAVNELIEFLAVIILPQTGVGGYENTLLDMVSNTIGGIIAVGIINYKRLRES